MTRTPIFPYSMALFPSSAQASPLVNGPTECTKREKASNCLKSSFAKRILSLPKDNYQLPVKMNYLCTRKANILPQPLSLGYFLLAV